MRHLIPQAALIMSVLVAGASACDDATTTATGPSAPYAIGMNGGNVQAATAGSALPLPLLVHVTDQYGVGFAGAVVTFTATGGATTTATTVTTDANGDASNTATLGTSAGIDSITASIAGVVVPVRFSETALAGPPATDSIASGNVQVGTSGTALPVPLSVVVLDGHGNRVAGDTVTWVSATGTLSAPVTVTDAFGIASVQLMPALGANTVTASIGGSTLVATFTETGN